MLSLEIGVKYRTKSQLGKTFKHLSSQVKKLVSFITYLSVQQLIRSSAKNQSKGINIRHASKLEALCNGKRFDVNYLDVDKIVVNLSSSTLTDTDVHLLSRGLTFSITPQQLDRIDIQTSFESFYHQLSTGKPESNLSCLKQRLRGLCFSYFYGYKKNNCSNLSKDELCSLKNLLKRQDIAFCKPDKGNGVVVLDKTDYNKKIFHLILQNSNSYKMIQQKNVKPAFSDISVYSITVEFFLWTHTIKFDPLAQILLKFMDYQNFTNRMYH